MNRLASLYIAIFALAFAALACGSVGVENVRIRDLPQFICATSVPLPTHTQPPTSTPQTTAVYSTPSGYATFTPQPGCIWDGVACATNTPRAGGLYTTPGVVIPGTTATPRPTYTPWPTATPYVLTGRFFMGADAYTGGFESEISLRLRIENPRVFPVDTGRQVVAWDLEIENVGQVTYATIPGGQVFAAEVGAQSGQWWASAEAAQAAGVTLQPEVLDVLEVQPGQSYRLTLTAFTPLGDPVRFGWVLDPLADARDGDLVGGNVAYWSADISAECDANPGGGVIVPTPDAPTVTPTPTPTPRYPAWCTWCGG